MTILVAAQLLDVHLGMQNVVKNAIGVTGDRIIVYMSVSQRRRYGRLVPATFKSFPVEVKIMAAPRPLATV